MLSQTLHDKTNCVAVIVSMSAGIVASRIECLEYKPIIYNVKISMWILSYNTTFKKIQQLKNN